MLDCSTQELSLDTRDYMLYIHYKVNYFKITAVVRLILQISNELFPVWIALWLQFEQKYRRVCYNRHFVVLVIGENNWWWLESTLISSIFNINWQI